MGALTTVDRPGSLALFGEPATGAWEERAAPGARGYERRASPRRGTAGEHLAAFVRAGGAARVSRVELVDISGEGLGVWSASAVEVGSRLLLYRANGRAPVDCGVVVRCDRDGDGWRVGVSGGGRAAA